MRRFWASLFLVGLVVIGVGASALAGSGKTTATYWSNSISAYAFDSSVGHSSRAGLDMSWLGYGKTATYKFDVAGIPALSGSVALNFSAYSTSLQPSGGAGFDTNMKVVVTGVATSTMTGTLKNLWEHSHVAYNNDAPDGWAASASMLVPNGVWKGATTLTVTVTSTSSTFMGLSGDSLHVSYASAA
jgi:hypothetical protein